MKVAVIGAGIIGITTAYELALDGHEVTVFERTSAAAEEASFAHAGIVAPACMTPWVAPGLPALLGSGLSRYARLRLRRPLSMRQLAWLWQGQRASQLDTYPANHLRLQQLAFYSRDRLHALSLQLGLDCERSPGYLGLLRTDKELQRAQIGVQALRDAGVEIELIDADQARQVEPALNPHTALAGAMHLPHEGTTNCRQFALLLKQQAQRLGVDFQFNKAVAHMERSHPATLLIASEMQPRRFDSVVLCAGVTSAALLAPLGLPLALAAVHGYSLTAPIREALHAPCGAVMDERHQVAISRLGSRVRIAGGAELGGSAASRHDDRLTTLYKVLGDWFPGAVQLLGNQASVQVWKGARALLPDGLPLIGPSGLPGLWLNLGHGGHGWALSCGSARALADQMAAKVAEIDMQGLDISRLR
ncbi:MAG: FAD-dependent oxidoreductase [Polaromonas sp.]